MKHEVSSPPQASEELCEINPETEAAGSAPYKPGKRVSVQRQRRGGHGPAWIRARTAGLLHPSARSEVRLGHRLPQG